MKNLTLAVMLAFSGCLVITPAFAALECMTTYQMADFLKKTGGVIIAIDEDQEVFVVEMEDGSLHQYRINILRRPTSGVLKPNDLEICHEEKLS